MISFDTWWIPLGAGLLALTGTVLKLIFSKPKGSLRINIQYERHPEVRSIRRKRRALPPPKIDD
jgi:hypothetical protein